MEPYDVRKLSDHRPRFRLGKDRIGRSPNEECRDGQSPMERLEFVQPREFHVLQKCHCAVDPILRGYQGLDEPIVKVTLQVRQVVETAAEAQRRLAKRA